KIRLILFEGMHLWRIPGASRARISVMDSKGRRLVVSEFSTGWRIDIDGARWFEDAGHGFPGVLICSTPSIQGANIVSQYYAFLDEGFALVRLQDSEGNFVPVNFEHTHSTIGPSIPRRTAEQWEAALHSSVPSEVIRTLVWLGGYPTRFGAEQGNGEQW